MSRVETQKHAHLLTGQNPCWHCETHPDRDPDMSAWFPFGLHVIHSVVEQTIEMFLVDWISTLIDLPPFEGNICLLPVTSISGLIFELICPWLWMGVWTWLCIFPTWLMCPVPAHGLNLICLLICLFLTADCLYGDWSRLRLVPPTYGFTWCWNWRSFTPNGSIYGVWVGDGARWYFELVCAVPWPLDNFWNQFWPVIDIPPPIWIEFLLVTNGKAFCFICETTFREIGLWTCWFWLLTFWVWVLCVPSFVEYIFNPFEADRRLWIWMMFLGTDGCRWLRSNGKYSIY